MAQQRVDAVGARNRRPLRRARDLCKDTPISYILTLVFVMVCFTLMRLSFRRCCVVPFPSVRTMFRVVRVTARLALVMICRVVLVFFAGRYVPKSTTLVSLQCS